MILLKKKRLFIIIGSIFLIIILIGVIDYVRVKNNKKPIFIYQIEIITYKDINKTSAEYYGIGYKVSTCDNKSNSYTFNIGHKKSKNCTTILNCTESERENFVTSHSFSFYDGKLYKIDTNLLRPTNKIDNEKKFVKDIQNLNNIDYFKTSIEKIDNNTYQIIEECNVLKMSLESIDKYCTISYLTVSDILSKSESEVIDYYSNTMKCK